MGEPGWGNAHSSVTEFIGYGTRTEGTETSQYLEEKEIKRDCPSSGERTGNSLNQVRAIESGVAGRSRGLPRRVTKSGDSRRLWKEPPQKVTAL
jgi:hypothetical protein